MQPNRSHCGLECAPCVYSLFGFKIKMGKQRNSFFILLVGFFWCKYFSNKIDFFLSRFFWFHHTKFRNQIFMIPKRKTCPVSELSQPGSTRCILWLCSLEPYSAFIKDTIKMRPTFLQYPLFIDLNPKIVLNFSFAKTN